jgi:hypothetical protein
MNLTELFVQISHQMKAELKSARSAASHAGIKGTAFENIVKNFLSRHVPERLGICTGQLVDSTGNMSKQLDIIIYDKAYTPVLFKSEGIQVIPNECAYAVIEVKATLEASTLPSILANMLSVKDLKKTAYYQAESGLDKYYTVHGKRWAYWPTSYFVFAFESANPNSMMIPIIDHHNATSGQPERKIDLICLLDKGVSTVLLCGMTRPFISTWWMDCQPDKGRL